jgi:hypothetical protein
MRARSQTAAPRRVSARTQCKARVPDPPPPVPTPPRRARRPYIRACSTAANWAGGSPKLMTHVTTSCTTVTRPPRPLISPSTQCHARAALCTSSGRAWRAPESDSMAGARHTFEKGKHLRAIGVESYVQQAGRVTIGRCNACVSPTRSITRKNLPTTRVHTRPHTVSVTNTTTDPPPSSYRRVA